jgi:hypothetical protein
MDVRNIGCDDGRWIELSQDYVQSWAFILAVYDLQFLLAES